MVFVDRKGVFLEFDFNYVWLEFYIFGFGWIFMELNLDDLYEGGFYFLRFFMGLVWYYVEIGKGIRFEEIKNKGVFINKENNKEKILIGNLVINYIRFIILEELLEL